MYSSFFQGTYTALVTPFCDDKAFSIDHPAWEQLLRAQLQAGIEGVVVGGTTGEGCTLTEAEHDTLLEKAVSVAKGRMQVVANTGTFSTQTTIARSLRAHALGADALMVIVPYYNKPTQAGLIHHFVTVAGAVPCPILLYNVPGRTGVDLSVDALAQICAQAPNVLGLKEATGNVVRAQHVLQRLGGRLAVLSGDDALTLPMMAVGAKGVVSVASNLLPTEVRQVVQFALAGQIEAARAMHLPLVPVYDSLFHETNPGPIKAALAAQGGIREVLRSPLVPVMPSTREAVLATLNAYKEGR